MQFTQIFLSETTKPRAFIFGIYHHLGVLYQCCSKFAPGVKIDPAPGVTLLHWIIQGKVQTTSSLEQLMVIWPNSTGMVPGWSPTKIVQMVLIGCICRSRGQKIGFQNASFKNLLVWNYKAQRFHIWYIASSRGPLPKLFKLWPWNQNWPCPGGHNFTLNYIRKISNDFKIILNLLWEFDQTQQEWSLGSHLPKLFKWFLLVAYVGHGVKK